jgi:hypothetical protein
MYIRTNEGLVIMMAGVRHASTKSGERTLTHLVLLAAIISRRTPLAVHATAVSDQMRMIQTSIEQGLSSYKFFSSTIQYVMQAAISTTLSTINDSLGEYLRPT